MTIALSNWLKGFGDVQENRPRAPHELELGMHA